MSSIATPLPRLAARPRRGPPLLWRAAGTVLALMPVAMAVAHRSSPLVVGVAALLAAAALTTERGWASFAADVQDQLRTPIGRAVLGFLAWSALSLSWSEFRAASLAALLEFWLPIAGSLFLALTLPRHLPRWGVWILVAGVALACGIILADLST